MVFSKKKILTGEINYLVSTSDMMAGLLFVFIIALVIQMCAEVKTKLEYEETKAALEETRAEAEEEKQRAERIKQQLAGADIARKILLDRVKKGLAKAGIVVTTDDSNGVLRLPEAAITFNTGKSTLLPEYIDRLNTVKRVLISELACFVPGAQYSNCANVNKYHHTLDAVFIEGHTDNQPYGGDETGKKNRQLSTERANTVYSILLDDFSCLSDYKNPRGQQLFSLSGYGSERPVPGHKHKKFTDDPVNRRIELRFLMTAPSLEEK